MAAFKELNWRRIDVTAIVTCGGLACIDEGRHSACRNWLFQEGYAIDTFDCQPGLNVAIPALGRLLNWEQEFGYALKSDSRNLDALRDGFDFIIPDGGGRVFEIIRPDLACQENKWWLHGLISIAMEQSRQQLALGRRFFALLVVPEQSSFIGSDIETTRVPGLYHDPCRELNEFAP